MAFATHKQKAYSEKKQLAKNANRFCLANTKQKEMLIWLIM